MKVFILQHNVEYEDCSSVEKAFSSMEKLHEYCKVVGLIYNEESKAYIKSEDQCVYYTYYEVVVDEEETIQKLVENFLETDSEAIRHKEVYGVAIGYWNDLTQKVELLDPTKVVTKKKK